LKLNPVLRFGVLIALGALIYSNSFSNSFHFDDFPTIVNNPSIKSFHDLHDMWGSEPTRFIASFSFALNYHWGGLNVVGYHLLSLLIHVATAILVWRFVLLIAASSADASWIAFFTAAIFLTHPLQTQAVNYIYQRAVLLAAFFYMSSLVLYIEANLAWEAKRISRGQFYYGSSLICAALSMLSKENAVSLPFMICFCQWFLISENKIFDWRKIAPFFAVILIMPLSWGLLNFHTLMGIKKTFAGLAQGLTVQQYALTQGKVVLTYLKLLILPVHQRVEYDFTAVPSFFDGSVLGSLSLLAIILGTAVVLRKRFRLVSFGIFWFFITLMPESSFWPNRDLIYEHRLYLPMLGFGIFLSSALFYFFQGKRASLAIPILIALVAVYSILTYQRNKIWKSELTLWDDAVHQSPQSCRAYLNRGAAYQRQGDLDHALADYNMAIGLGPVEAVTLSNRGMIFEEKGEPDLALANFNLAIKTNPSFAGTYINRGKLYLMEGKFDQALEDFNKAIAAIPDDPEIYGDRAAIYYQQKDYEKCWQDVRKVEALGSSIKPEYLQALKKDSGTEH